MEWTREKTLALINEYRKRRGLWDMTADDYRKKEMKQKLLIEVSASLGGGIPIVEIEKKFHTLRTQYHREINRMKRKEPYNSKWFGFKNLQFLSSPKACRSNRSGRIKSEITEEGTVTTKYIIREQGQPDHSEGSSNPSGNLNDEYMSMSRKPATTTITYELAAAPTGAVNSARSQELEKLIEETTKDVEELEEEKPPKMSIKEIGVPMEQHHTYTPGAGAEGSCGDVTAIEVGPIHPHEQHQQQMEEDDDGQDIIDIQQPSEGEVEFLSASSSAHNATLHHHHHGPLPTRIIKIQRRDTCHEDNYYQDQQQHQQEQEHHQQQSHQNLHTLPAGSKRIYYEANGHQHTANILTTPTATPQPVANSTLLNSASAGKMQQLQSRSTNSITLSPQTKQQQSQQLLRDEFSTYGEYVGNEMREITNREILVALKHKINMALFEASMAELQQK